MAIARVEKELDVPADALWALVEDFGRCDWIPGAAVELQGEGVGMVRVMAGTIRERLDAVDPDTRTLRYSIADEGIPFPVKGYCATMRVEDAPGGRSRLRWSCECEPVGVSAAEATGRIEGMYETMIGWIEAKLRG